MTVSPPLVRHPADDGYRPSAPHDPRPPAADRHPGAAVPTLFGALAVIGGATALIPLIAGVGWLLPIAEVALVIWLVGVGARLLGASVLLSVVAKFVAFALCLTGLQLDAGIGGLLPGPGAVAEAAGMARGAWTQIMTTVPPMPATPEMTFFVTLVLGIVALVVDVLIAEAQVPAMTGLPLLGLYSVPAAIASSLLPWYAFVLPTICFTAVLVTTQRGDRRTRGRAVLSLVVTGGVIAAASIGAALVVTDTATGIGTAGRIPHTGRPAGQVGLSPWALLRGNLTDSDPVPVLSVDGLSTPTYLRTVALDKWEPDKGFVLGSVTADVKNIDGTLPGSVAADADQQIVSIVPQQFRDKYLPMYLGSSAVNGIGSGWNYDAGLTSSFRTYPDTPAPYTVTADTTPPTEEQLIDDPVVPDAPLTETGTLPAEVTDLARKATVGAKTDFAKVDALLTFFTDPVNGFTYSLHTPEGSSGNALVDFLTDRQGYCEQYAAAMAIMVRSLGIPARIGIGFTQGSEQADGSYEVLSTDAHAWVEVPFKGVGWVMFDPTPAVAGQGGLQGFAPGGGSSTSPTAPTTAAPTTTGTAVTTTAPTTTAPTTPTATSIAPAGTAAHTSGHFGGAAALVGLLVLAIVAAVAAPTAVRSQRRRRRQRVMRDGGAPAAAAAWREVLDSAMDHGLAVPRDVSARVAADAIAGASEMSHGATRAMSRIVGSVEEQWYAKDASAPPQDLGGSVDAVVAAIGHRRPLSLLGRWWPRSLLRRA